MYFDTSNAVIHPTSFTGSTAEAFRNQYRGAKEEPTIYAPKARGRAVEVTAFVDASHASDNKIRQSHTSCTIFNIHSPIIWYSNIQTTVESSTFGG